MLARQTAREVYMSSKNECAAPSAPLANFRTLAAVKSLFPGVLACTTIGLAAAFLSDHYGGPLMLYALMFGVAFNFLHEHPACVAGIEFASRSVLRLGVALLGARITIDQVVSLGLHTVLMVMAAVASTIFFGAFLARRLGLSRQLGLLSGGAVAICGASAALALSSVLPRHKDSERDTIVTVIGVTTLSTVAMVAYPVLVRALGMDDTAAGLFLGATIHDVAQVVGAGYMISESTGDTSAIVKLLRVALLMPVVLCLGLLLPRKDNAPIGMKTVLPGFLLLFALIVVINSVGMIPAPAQSFLADSSRWMLVTAIAALGAKTSFRTLSTVGWRPVIMMVTETVFLAALVLGALKLTGLS